MTLRPLARALCANSASELGSVRVRGDDLLVAGDAELVGEYRRRAFMAPRSRWPIP